jgi:aspartyl-tRNA(Asn)/glutamyl-tRNA(Gln) amidotransferase subunit C
MLSKDEVKNLAKLSRISLTEQEVEGLQKDLTAILEYIDELKQVNVEGLEEVSQVTGLVNVQREDKPQDVDYHEAIFKNAPEMKDGYYKVKAIL